MARTTQVKMTDDFDGSPAARAITFGLDGAWYLIDLNSKHADEFTEVLRRHIEVAARVPAPARRGRRQLQQAADTTKQDRTDARAWLEKQGHPVKGYGMIPNPLFQLWVDAGKPRPASR